MLQPIDPNTRIGTVSLTVADLARSLAYYENSIGLTVQNRTDQSALLGANGTALLSLTEKPGARLVKRATGLYHFALLVPSRLELARTLQHLIQSETPVGGASDHHVSEALYLSDPDGHGVEIYRDRPRDAWVDENGDFRLDTAQLDVQGVMNELENDYGPWSGLSSETTMGHIHLQVADVDAARQFYMDVLGFGHMADYPGATFLSAGGYHHHIGMNSWMGAGAPPPPVDAARLVIYEVILPDEAALSDVLRRVNEAGLPSNEAEDGWIIHDPSQNEVLLTVA